MLIHRAGLEIHNAAMTPEEAADTKYNLAAIYITPDGSVAACDGRSWLRMCASVDSPDLFTEQLAGESSRGQLEQPVTIPADVAKAFLAASKRKAKPGQKSQQLVVAIHEGAVTLATADGKTRRTFIIDESDAAPFPAFERTIPKGKAAVKLTLDIDLLLKMLGTLKRCGASACEWSIRGDETPIRITARVYRDDSESILDGVMMPMHPPQDADDAKPDAETATPTGPMFDAAQA